MAALGGHVSLRPRAEFLMPASILEPILQAIVEFVLQVAGYVTARILVPVLSLGRAYVEPAPKGVHLIPKWHGFARDSTWKITVDCEMGVLLGLLFWLFVVIVGVI